MQTQQKQFGTKIKYRKDQSPGVTYEAIFPGVVGQNAIEIAALKKGIPRRNITSQQHGLFTV